MDLLLSDLRERADREGSAISIFDSNDRLVGCNDRLRDLYPGVSLDDGATYDKLFWENVRRHRFDDTVTRDPATWLAGAKGFRKQQEAAQFLRQLADGTWLLIVHERLPGTGGWSYSSRRLLDKSAFSQFSIDWPLRGQITVPVPVASTRPPGLDWLAMPAAIVDRTATVVALNRGFVDLASPINRIFSVDQKVTIKNAADNAAFKIMLSNLADPRETANKRAIRLTGTGCGENMVLCVSRYSGPESGHTDPGRFLLTVVAPDRLPELNTIVLMDLYDLTAAEAEVAASIGSGLSVDDIAQQRGVSKHTVYCQVKAILAKMGVARQSDLARHIAVMSVHLGDNTNDRRRE